MSVMPVLRRLRQQNVKSEARLAEPVSKQITPNLTRALETVAKEMKTVERRVETL